MRNLKSLCLSLTSLLFLTFIFILPEASSQEIWVAYSQVVSIEEYEGLHFKYTASVRASLIDDSASARLWARIDKKSGMGFFENMDKRPIRNKNWNTYTINGTVDSGANQMVFGLMCTYNGQFFYDKLNIDIEIAENQWKNIYSADFEGDTAAVRQEIQKWWNSSNDKFSAGIHIDSVEGNQCLMIVGSGVPTFGINKEAGSFAHVNGIQLYYEIYGTGQPLVVLHGNGGSIVDASTHYPYFIDRNYQLIAIDSRAQGRSGNTEKELTYRLLASDVNELLNQLNLDSVYLWGHSDGAIVGIVMAINYPGRIKKLVAFAPNIQADSNAILPPIYRWIEKKALTSKNPEERKLAAMMWKYPDISLSELSTVQSEVLLMAGDRDFTPLSHTIEIFENLPYAQLCIIPGATHIGAWEKEELFLQIVTEFFEKPFKMPNTMQLIGIEN